MRRGHPDRPCKKCGGPIEPHVRKWGHRCRACRTKATRAWLEKHPDWREAENRRARLKNWRKLGIEFSNEEYEAMFRAQGGRCAICRTPKPSGKGAFHLDHDHDFRHVRGLLCSRCNQALGLFKDSPQLLRAALKYLDSHRPQLKLVQGE